MNELYVCPKCRGKVFVGYVKSKKIIELKLDNSGSIIPILIGDGDEEDSLELQQCNDCHTVVTDFSDLLVLHQCTECKDHVTVDELENGICQSCLVPPDLKGLTEKDLIKEIIRLRKLEHNLDYKSKNNVSTGVDELDGLFPETEEGV